LISRVGIKETRIPCLLGWGPARVRIDPPGGRARKREDPVGGDGVFR
jgi:hypothetical protein